MAKKKSFYENEYTKQLDEAIFDQKGYDEKKVEQKKKVQAESHRHKGMVRLFIGLCLVGVAMGAKYLINLDPDNAGPITVFLSLAAIVFFFVKWIHK